MILLSVWGPLELSSCVLCVCSVLVVIAVIYSRRRPRLIDIGDVVPKQPQRRLRSQSRRYTLPQVVYTFNSLFVVVIVIILRQSSTRTHTHLIQQRYS